MSGQSISIKEILSSTSLTSPPEFKPKPSPSNHSISPPKSESFNRTSKTISSIKIHYFRNLSKRKLSSLSSSVIKSSLSKAFSSVMTMDTFSRPVQESMSLTMFNPSNSQSYPKVSLPYPLSTGKSTLKPKPQQIVKSLTEQLASSGNQTTQSLSVKMKKSLISEAGLPLTITVERSTLMPNSN